MKKITALAVGMLALTPASTQAEGADAGERRSAPDATLRMQRFDERRLPCRPSDLEARKRGRVLRERYGPYRAYWRRRAVLEIDGAYALAASRVKLHIWCRR